MLTSSRNLLARAKDGDRSALSSLLVRHLVPLQRWAHRRLPQWVRSMADTADIVQDAVLRTLRHLDRFQPQGQGALRAYLRRAVDNRINDEFRQFARRGATQPIDDGEPYQGTTPLEEAIGRETEGRYRAALARLRLSDRRLIVARVELGYSFEQLTLLTGRRKSDAARIALHRALLRLAAEMDRV